jgi:YVTN family beta-propeller protein
VDVAIAWGPVAGYFAKHARVPLDVTPVPNDGDAPAERFVYPIAMGVRKGDDSLHVALERALDRRRPQIDRILAEYGVPIVGAPAAGADDERAYVTNEGGRMLSVISTATDRVIASIPVGTRPRGVRIRPDGRTLFVALSGSPRCPPTMSDADCAAQRADRSKDGIAVIDAATRRVTRILPGGTDPEQFDLTPDGRWLVAANEDVGLASIVDVPSGRIVAQVPVGGEPEGVRVSRDGATAYVTSEAEHRVTAIDLARRVPRGRATVDARPRDLALMPDGRRYWASAEVGGTVSLVDGATGQVLRRVALPNGAKPMGLAVAPDGGRLYVATGRGGTVEVVDTRAGRIVGSVKVGARPWGIALTRDGRKLYVANGPSNDVSVVDTQRLRVTATIAVGALPWGIAIGPAAY